MKVVKQVQGLEIRINESGRIFLVVGTQGSRRTHSFAMCNHSADDLGQALLRAAAAVRELGLSCRDDHSEPDAEA